MKLWWTASCAFWGIGIAVAIISIFRQDGEGVYLLICSAVLLALTLWAGHREWIFNDKGVWERLARAIKKNRPEQAARCVREVVQVSKLSLVHKNCLASYLSDAFKQQRWQVADAMLQAGATFGAESLVEECVRAGNLRAVRMLLEHGVNPDAGGYYPPLLRATAEGRQDMAELLLAHGATPLGKPTRYNPEGLTALHVLCAERNPEMGTEAQLRIATGLLQEGADVNALTTGGFTPLDAATDARHPGTAAAELRDLLLAHGAKHGPLLRVPHACYTAELRIKGKPTEWPTVGHGCRLHAENEKAEVYCQAEAGELPIATAARLATAVQELCHSGLVTAADLGGGFTRADKIAKAEQPLLYMLRLHPCSTDELNGLETEGMHRFGLPELRTMHSPSTHRDWIVYPICHILSAYVQEQACPAVNNTFFLENGEENDLFGREEYFELSIQPKLHGEGMCLEIKHMYS